MAVLLYVVSCGEQIQISSDTNSISTEKNNVILEVDSSNCEAGTKNLDIFVSVKNNPCILGMDFEVYYDDSSMTLIKSESLIDVEGVNFTSPAYYRNPTFFVWDFMDAVWNNDGDILKLTFEISDSAKVGDYVVGINYSYGNIFDKNGAPLVVSLKTGTIHIFD